MGEKGETLKERSNLGRLEREKARKKIYILAGIVAAVVILAVAALMIWNITRTRCYTNYEVLDTFERADAGKVKYDYYEGDILKYSRDGITGIGSDGTALWNGSYEMSNPMVDSCGSFVAVCDKGKKDVYVYSGADDGTMVTMPLPVSMIRVAGQGVFAVVLEDSSSDVVALYDPYATGEKLLVEIPSNVADDGYPVDIALSEDAKSLVTVFLATKDGVQTSNVCFYNFSEVGQDTNRIVGGKTYQENLAIGAEFISEDEVCVFLDQGFTLFENMKKPEEVKTVAYEQEIKSAFFDEGYAGFVLADDTIDVYNSKGDNELNTKIDIEYDNIEMHNEEVIVTSGSECLIYRLNGSLKFSKVFDNPVDYVFNGKDKEIYYIIDGLNIYKVKLTED